MNFASLGWMVVFAAGCGSVSGPSDGAAGDVATGGMCVTSVSCPADPSVPVHKACVQDSDCVTAQHVTNCCGSVETIGVRADSAAAFAAADQTCVRAALCDCAAPNTIEDGTTWTASEPIEAICRLGCCLAIGPVH